VLSDRWTGIRTTFAGIGLGIGCIAVVLLSVDKVELGLAPINSGTWLALLAPLATPAPIIARLNRATNDALQAPAMRDALGRLGAEPRGGTPDDLARHMRAKHQKWAPVVAALGLREE
jgi:tripartite-type tricarboxylate transporter receptor subunit TctC